MTKFQYQIIRYRHDVSTGEFVNVGLVFFVPSEKLLKVIISNKYKRISDFFNGVSGTAIIRAVKNIENKIKVFTHKYNSSLDFKNYQNLKVLTEELFPKDDGSIQFSDLYSGVAPTQVEFLYQELFDNLVYKYVHSYSHASRSDEDARKIIYKDYFDKLYISPKLQKKEIKTTNDSFEFDGWKNGRWNYYKPISFDLIEKESIKDKVYKWAGINSELFTADESFNLYFLSLSPRMHSDNELRSFIKNKLEVSNTIHTVKVIYEEELENFTNQVSEEIKNY